MGVLWERKIRSGGWVFDCWVETGGSTPSELSVAVASAPDEVEQPLTGHLRTFWFGDIDDAGLISFCRSVAAEPAQRAELAAGTVDWQVRDTIFFRSLLWLTTSRGYGSWLDQAAPGLLRCVTGALPDLAGRHAAVLATETSPPASEPDPGVLPGLEALWAAGLSTRWSCQGAAGHVDVDGYTVILGRHHEPVAYVAFEPGDAARLVVEAGRAGLVTHPGSLAPGRFAVPHPADNADISDRLCRVAELVAPGRAGQPTDPKEHQSR